jgi:hypothetical protein
VVLELELADRCVDIIEIRAEGFIVVAREGLLPLQRWGTARESLRIGVQSMGFGMASDNLGQRCKLWCW